MSVLVEKVMAASEDLSIMNNLFNDGNYGCILVKVFEYLDGSSLEACHLVNKQWRAFLMSYVTTDKVMNRFKQSLKTGVPTTRRMKLDGKFMSMKCDNTSIIAGKLHST